jgi:signal transduction histidine kinase/HAMP domain-containing protein
VIVLALTWIAAGGLAVAPDSWLEGTSADVETRAEEIVSALDRIHDEAVGIAAEALGSFPPELASSPAREVLLERLEGIAIVDPDGGFLIWQGSPADPPGGFLDPQGAVSWIERHGSVSRWIVRAGPDGEGWLSLASFTLRFDGNETGLAAFLPADLTHGVDVRLVPGEGSTALEGTLTRSWSAGERSEPVEIRLRPAIAGVRAERLRGQALAIAVMVTLIMLAFVPGWRARLRTTPGFVQAVIAIVGSRLLLGWTETPQWLLARDASSAGLFGVRTFGRLLASPADLLLTGAALYLLALALRIRLGNPSTRIGPAARWTLIGATLATAVLTGRLIVVISRNSRDALLDTGGEWISDARLWVGAGLMLALLAVASLASSSLLRSALSRPSALEALVPTVLCFSVLAIATALVLQFRQETARLERLRVDIAPQVLEQTERRTLALTAAIAEVQHAYEAPSPGSLVLAPGDLAFHYWIDSALAHGGYQSALDFYDLNLELQSHFGYDIPELDEVVGPLDELTTTVTDEPFQPVPSVRQRLLHVEAPLYRDGELRGLVVGHVLDEPDNLPFLPVGRAYLAALGQQRAAGESELHYVVYDAQGTPLRSTLTRPPAERGEFRLAALEGRPVAFRTGDQRFVGIALGERDRLHLLLVEDPGPLERLAGALRFLLVGLILVVIVKLLPQLLRPSGAGRLQQALRGSFQRKLVAATLIASVVPLIGLSLILRGYIETRASEELASTAVGFAGAAQKLIDDAIAPLDPNTQEAGPDAFQVSDSFLLWLRRVVGQDVHVYEHGRLTASSKRELFDAGVVPERLDGWVQRQITLEGRPSLVQLQSLGGHELPVAYAPVRNADAARQMVVAVPMVREPGQIQREVQRVAEIILVATMLLVALLVVAATYFARTVASPLRALAGATAQIAAGDYGTRLRTQTRDEVAEVVRGFNAMASSLKQQRTALERRREYIEALLQHATTGILSIDRHGTIVTLNPTAETLLSSVGAKVVIGGDLGAALEPCDALAGLRAALRDTARAEAEPVEFDLQDGKISRRLRMVRVRLPGAEGGSVGTLILLDDVTELMRSNQLSAWAEMARAIAHEIKNPLTPIQLSTEHLRRLLDDRGVFPDEKIDACIDTVIKQVRTLYEIAGEFSTYAKLPVLTPEPHDPVEFMREMLSPYRSSAIEGIELVEDYEESPAVAIDYRVLTRAVVNLIQNAIQAMPDGGQLRVSVQPTTRDRVEIGVRDTGIGLDPEVTRRLFEPYFSTKSSGTGLGLAITLRAVEAHQGTIEVDSESGRGTSFRILLPIA